MVKKAVKFIFGGIVIMHALNSYTKSLAVGFEKLADKEEVKANGGSVADIDKVSSRYEFVPYPKAIYRNCKKVAEQVKRYVTIVKNED